MVQRYFRFLSVASNNFTSLAWGILKANFWEFEFDPQVQSWLAVCIGWVTGSLIKQWSKRRKNELDERSPTKLSASQPILTMTHIQLHNKSPNKLQSTLQWRWVNYGPLDPWNIFCTIFWTNFWTIFFGPIYRGGAPLVLWEGWDAVYQCLGRGERQTVVTQGEVEDELLVRREGWEVVIEVNATDWWSFY